MEFTGIKLERDTLVVMIEKFYKIHKSQASCGENCRTPMATMLGVQH